MIICVSRQEVPLRPPQRLRSPRPRAAVSDRVLPHPFHTKLHLSLMLRLLLGLIVYPVSSLFLGLYRVPLLKDVLSNRARIHTPRHWRDDLLPHSLGQHPFGICHHVWRRSVHGSLADSIGQYSEALIPMSYLDTRENITHALPTYLILHTSILPRDEGRMIVIQFSACITRLCFVLSLLANAMIPVVNCARFCH